MIKGTLRTLMLFIVAATVGYQGLAQTSVTDWHQFRGKDRSGSSPEKIEKGATGFEVVWKKNIPSGFSELIVSDGTLYTMFGEKTDSISGSEYLAAYKATDGELLWKTEVDSIFLDVDGWGDGPRSTPTADSDAVYCFSAFGKLSAHSKKDGKQLWQVDFRKEFGSETPRWGFSASPLLFDDKIILEAGGKNEQAYVAIDKKNGKVVWAKGKGKTSYISPVVFPVNGTDQIIFISNDKMSAYNSAGDTLWTYKMSVKALTAVPVFIAPNQLFVSSVHAGGFSLIEVDDNKAKEIAKGNSMKNDFSTCCYHDGYIYGFHIAALRCIDAKTGETKWTKRGLGKGSLILVDGKLLVLSDKGKLLLAEATPEAFKELGFNQALKGKSWTAPSFSGGHVFIRNLTEMACLKIK